MGLQMFDPFRIQHFLIGIARKDRSVYHETEEWWLNVSRVRDVPQANIELFLSSRWQMPEEPGAGRNRQRALVLPLEQMDAVFAVFPGLRRD